VKYFLLDGAPTLVARLFAQVTPSSDPFSFFTSLGVGGGFALIVWLWQRDTAKQRDHAMQLLTDYLADHTEALREIRTAIDLSTDAHEKGTNAAEAMIDTLKGMPPRETWVRVIDALDRREGRSR
jgi:hypothetical protein